MTTLDTLDPKIFNGVALALRSLTFDALTMDEHRDLLRRAIPTYRAADALSSIPEQGVGVKLVPVEPTQEMINAGLKRNAQNPHPWVPAVYRAMLAAAPSHPGAVAVTDEMVGLGPDGKEWAKTEAGYAHVESIRPVMRPEGNVYYGHAVREAFVAGAEWQEHRAALASHPAAVGPTDEVAAAPGYTDAEKEALLALAYRKIDDTESGAGFTSAHAGTVLDLLERFTRQFYPAAVAVTDEVAPRKTT